MGSETTQGILSTLARIFEENGIDDWRNKLVAFVADGAAINLGERKGVSTLLRQRSPWLVSIHCFNHRLELAVKDALGQTNFRDVTTFLDSLYATYSISSKRLRELRETSKLLKEAFFKPQRVDGT